MTKFRYIQLLLFLWTCTSIVAQTNQYMQFDNLQGKTRHLCVRAITQSNDGLIWLAAESGLYSFDGYNLHHRHISFAKQPHTIDGLPNGKPGKVRLGSFNCILNAGDSLVIGCNNGLVSFNLSSFEATHLPYARGESVRGMEKTGDDLWVATAQSVYRNGRKTPLVEEEIVSLNRIGDDLYVGTLSSVSRYSLTSHTMEDVIRGIHVATCVHKASDNRKIWIGTAEKLILWDMEAKAKVHEVSIPIVKCISQGEEGNTMVGSDAGLWMVQSDGTVSTMQHDALTHFSIAGDAVWSIFPGKDGNIWIGTNSGISLIRSNNISKHYFLPSITGHRDGNQLYCIYRDSKERYWMGGSNGLLCIEQLGMPAQTCRWYRVNDVHYPIRHNRVRCITEDERHRIWLGGDMGINLLDEETRQFVRFRLGTNTYEWIYDIRQAKQGMLEVSTLDETFTVKPDYDKRTLDIVTRRKLNGSNASHPQDKSIIRRWGMKDKYLSLYSDKECLLLGGTDEFVVFNNDSASAHMKSHAPLVTDIQVNNGEYVSRQDILEGASSFAPDHTTLRVFVTDFDFADDYNDCYYYKVEGTADWIGVNIKTSNILLTNLAPGKYKLLMRREGEEEHVHCVYTFTIQAHWYDTTLAHIIYIILLAAIIYGTYRLVEIRRRLKIERQERSALLAKAKKKEEELLDDNEYLECQLRLQLIEKSDSQGELSDDEKFLLNITRIIEENMDDSELNVNKLSEKSGISTKQLYRRIKAMTGMTTVAYIRDQRLKKAASLLCKGSFSVSEVMYMVGFASASYFTRCFAEEYGITPSEYIEKNKQNHKNTDNHITN